MQSGVRGDVEGEDGNLGRSGREGVLKQSLDRQRGRKEKRTSEPGLPNQKARWLKSRALRQKESRLVHRGSAVPRFSLLGLGGSLLGT